MFLQTLDILTQMLALLARLISVFIMDIMFKHERVNYFTGHSALQNNINFVIILSDLGPYDSDTRVKTD